MCGINGFNFSDPTLVRKMNSATAHRGPDESDVWVGDGVSLGHNRLAIIDLSPRGHQPMWDAVRELVIVFNGEIYNYQELRAELELEYQFQSQSDTEVILNAYKKYGADCVKKFNGIFAFAIYNPQTQDLFLARDHAGVKPLYYYQDGDRFIFSSEIKGILEHPVPRAVDQEAFNLFFQVLYVPEPFTMFAGIKKLPAAHYATVSGGKLNLFKYWQSAPAKPAESYHQTAVTIKNIFRDSVKHQLISDRPVGIFLSGGFDSTAVLGAATEFHTGSIKTFSVGFKNSLDTEKFNADLVLARKTAKYYHTDHTELMIGPKDIWSALEKIVWHFDEPNFNATAGAIYLLAEEAKKSVAVVLGGDGADELFGGYPRYHYSRLLSLYGRLGALGQAGIWLARKIGQKETADHLTLEPNENRVLAFLAQKPALLAKIIAFEKLDLTAAQSYFKARYFSKPFLQPDFENYFMHIDREGWLIDESLVRTDKMAMAHGLEVRVPILDPRLIALSETIPVGWKFSAWQNPRRFQGKKIWKEAIGEYLPPHVLNQPKRGWFTPMAKWLRGDLREPVAEILAEAGKNSAYFNAAAIEKIWQEHLTGQTYNLNSIWAIVMWQLWYNRFIKK